jgi:hypothetical protein
MSKIKLNTDSETLKALIASCLVFHENELMATNNEMHLCAAYTAYEWAFDTAKRGNYNDKVTIKLTDAQSVAIVVVMTVSAIDHPLWVALYLELCQLVDQRKVFTKKTLQLNGKY